MWFEKDFLVLALIVLCFVTEIRSCLVTKKKETTTLDKILDKKELSNLKKIVGKEEKQLENSAVVKEAEKAVKTEVKNAKTAIRAMVMNDTYSPDDDFDVQHIQNLRENLEH